MIYKIITCIIRRVNIYHLHLAHIGVLEQFEYFEVIALNIEILGILPIYALLWASAQSLANRLGSLLQSRTFANPGEVVTFITFGDVIT